MEFNDISMSERTHVYDKKFVIKSHDDKYILTIDILRKLLEQFNVEIEEVSKKFDKKEYSKKYREKNREKVRKDALSHYYRRKKELAEIRKEYE